LFQAGHCRTAAEAYSTGVDAIPFWAQVAVLLALLLLSAFFSIAETALMAVSRLRLRHLAREGSSAARLTENLLARTDRLLGAILLGNNLLNAAATALVTAIAISRFGDNEWVLLGATVAIAFLIMVFSEITPKVVGARYPERIALPSSYVLRLILMVVGPAVWFVNLFVRALLWLLRVPPAEEGGTTRLSPEELRTIVLEGGNFIPGKHRSILLNLFDLEQLTVDDVMTPRARVEALDIAHTDAVILAQLVTCYHNKLPVYERDISRVVGVIHVRRLLPALAEGRLDAGRIRALSVAPYFVPSGTPLFNQLQMFQDNQQRLGLVVDEYGEVQGLVTLEDIIEELVGKFTTQAPGAADRIATWDAAGQAVVDGTIALRELNRRLALRLPFEGPKTLNGLLLELLEEIPDAPCCVRLPGCHAEIIQVQDQAIRSVRLIRSPERERAPQT
jgi:Mg2+/Co2+ transporter CorB